MRHAICFVLLLAACGSGGGGDDDVADDDGTPTPDADPNAPDAPPLGGDSVMRGVNLSSAEWGEGNLPGTYDTDYTYPTTDEVAYFQGKGLNTVRVAFRWERLQRTLGGDLDATELARLDALVGYATSQGVLVILDPHNYARYHDDLIGSAQVSRAQYADFWSRLADHYKADARVVFGLMNEPHDIVTEDWLAAANDAIAAIRATGATQLVLVPGNAWTGAHSWFQDWYGTPNATVMTGVVDPADHYAIELHQYLDADFSGTAATCQSGTIGSEKLAPVTTWAREHGIELVLGELGGGSDATCLAAIDDMLDHIDANLDVWRGWTWWAAGPWWNNYMFDLDPPGGGDAPQLPTLLEHVP
jgi:endoglucanase